MSTEPIRRPELPDFGVDAEGRPSASAPRADGRWRKTMTRRLWISDLIILAIVVFGTQLIWFGFSNESIATREDVLSGTPYWVISGILIALWMWVLALAETRDTAIVGSGNVEYMRVVGSSFRLFGGIAIFAFLLRVDLARGYMLLALPIGVLVLLAARWMWRHWLLRRRIAGTYSARALLVGSRGSVTQIARELERHPSAGYIVVGACVPRNESTNPVLARIPVVGHVDDIDRGLTLTDADTVIVTSTDDLPPEKVKEISWQLEAGRQHLVLAPSIIDIAGPRIHTRPVAGLPLIHVETPRFTLGQRVGKRLVDVLLGAVLLILLSPLLIGLAIAVRSTSSGPALFRQTRIGYAGHPFGILKFRSMVAGSEGRVGNLEQNSGNDVLFKMSDDPRVTPIGRVIRRHSLDELPQLFNVITGSMSLVGPRPPLPQEVAKYTDHVHRRFLVKPGMTGAWQVGGRSSLNWEDSVRLDLSYVENWTLTSDLVILARTFRAVVSPGDEAA